MSEGWRWAGDLASVALNSALFVCVGWVWIRRKRARNRCVPDRIDQPYTIFSRAFDLTLRARDVPATLSADPFLRGKGWVLLDEAIWHRKVAKAQQIVAAVEMAAPRANADGHLGGWAICFLVDQSGSMRDEPIAHVAAALRVQVGRLMERGARVAVLGFSTVGWHGGRARQQWLFDGQPKRPGRLCVLLHVIYQEFGNDLHPDDWNAMLHPDILRENIDGEALLWAVSRLQADPAPQRALIVLSDGAPVDDTTLLHNGSGYLERHLRSVIEGIEAERQIALGAVGVGCDVRRYYAQSESAEALEDLPSAIETLVTRMTLASA